METSAPGETASGLVVRITRTSANQNRLRFRAPFGQTPSSIPQTTQHLCVQTSRQWRGFVDTASRRVDHFIILFSKSVGSPLSSYACRDIHQRHRFTGVQKRCVPRTAATAAARAHGASTESGRCGKENNSAAAPPGPAIRRLGKKIRSISCGESPAMGKGQSGPRLGGGRAAAGRSGSATGHRQA